MAFFNFSKAASPNQLLKLIGRGNVNNSEAINQRTDIEVTKNSSSNNSSGPNSFAYGTGNTASGAQSFAGGRECSAITSFSFAIGSGNTAIALGSYAEGIRTRSNQTGTHTEGGYTMATGEYSHAEGFLSTASTAGSHAGGGLAVTTRSFEWARSSYIYYNGVPSINPPQHGKVSLGTRTNGAGSSVMYPSYPIQSFALFLDNNSTFYLQLKVIGVIYSGANAGDSVSYTSEGIARNIANTASIVSPGFNTVRTFSNGALSGTNLSVSILGGFTELAISPSGLASTGINWFCEATYQKVTW